MNYSFCCVWASRIGQCGGILILLHLGIENGADVLGLEQEVGNRRSGKMVPGDDEEGSEESELEGRRNGTYFHGSSHVGEL